MATGALDQVLNWCGSCSVGYCLTSWWIDLAPYLTLYPSASTSSTSLLQDNLILCRLRAFMWCAIIGNRQCFLVVSPSITNKTVQTGTHPLSPEIQLSFNQFVQFCSRERQEVEDLVDASKELISLELMLPEIYQMTFVHRSQ